MPADSLGALAARVLDACRARHWLIGTAESCTGGLVAAALTDIPGSSDVVERGFVTYSDRAKAELLGVPVPTLVTHGAVSGETAAAMAQGVLAKSKVDLAVAVTGIAGPGGGSTEKPVGLVWFAVASRGRAPRIERQIFVGDRTAVRAAATRRALELLAEAAA